MNLKFKRILNSKMNFEFENEWKWTLNSKMKFAFKNEWKWILNSKTNKIMNFEYLGDKNWKYCLDWL